MVEYLLDIFRAIDVVGLCSSESLLHIAIRRKDSRVGQVVGEPSSSGSCVHFDFFGKQRW